MEANIDDLSTIENRAVQLLTRREHSATELKRKLVARGFDGGAIDQVLAKLQEKNLQSEERFLENYVRYRTNCGFGPIRIREELRQKGVPEELIANGLPKEDDDFWLPIITGVYRKKFKATHDAVTPSHKERLKIHHFLQYRGFTNRQITDVCRL